MFSISTNKFDAATLAIAGISYISGMGSNGDIKGTILTGIQCFALANFIDRVALGLFAPEARNVGSTQTIRSFLMGMGGAAGEELLYSGLLLTTSFYLTFPRMAAALFTGITAARSLVGRSEVNHKGFTLDTQIGFIWAFARESILWVVSESYSLPVVILTDSLIFALCELTPSDRVITPPKYSREWFGKGLSSYFFRAIANSAALRVGFMAPLTQHLLFNYSRSLS